MFLLACLCTNQYFTDKSQKVHACCIHNAFERRFFCPQILEYSRTQFTQARLQERKNAQKNRNQGAKFFINFMPLTFHFTCFSPVLLARVWATQQRKKNDNCFRETKTGETKKETTPQTPLNAEVTNGLFDEKASPK